MSIHTQCFRKSQCFLEGRTFQTGSGFGKDNVKGHIFRQKLLGMLADSWVWGSLDSVISIFTFHLGGGASWSWNKKGSPSVLPLFTHPTEKSPDYPHYFKLPRTRTMKRHLRRLMCTRVAIRVHQTRCSRPRDPPSLASGINKRGKSDTPFLSGVSFNFQQIGLREEKSRSLQGLGGRWFIYLSIVVQTFVLWIRITPLLLGFHLCVAKITQLTEKICRWIHSYEHL